MTTALPADVQQLLATAHLQIGRPVSGVPRGGHAASNAGPGRDFRDHRPYVPGDDPRRIDWRAYARNERVIVRETQGEDAITLALVVDGSAAMTYGEVGTNKWNRAAVLCAALAHIATTRSDRLLLSLGRSNAVEIDAPTRSPERAESSIATRFDRSPAGICPWRSLLEATVARVRGQAIFVCMSDYLDFGADEPGDRPTLDHMARLRSHGRTVIAVQVVHADELEFPVTGERLLRLEDPRGIRAPVEGPASRLRLEYLERLHDHLTRLRRSCDQLAIPFVTARTDAPAGPQLLAVLRAIERTTAPELAR